MTEIKPYMCSCCNDIWSRENQKSIKLGKYELHLCPDCYHEYNISNNVVLDKIKAEIFNACSDSYHMPVYNLSCEQIFEIIDKYMAESEVRNDY